MVSYIGKCNGIIPHRRSIPKLYLKIKKNMIINTSAIGWEKVGEPSF